MKYLSRLNYRHLLVAHLWLLAALALHGYNQGWFSANVTEEQSTLATLEYEQNPALVVALSGYEPYSTDTIERLGDIVTDLHFSQVNLDASLAHEAIEVQRFAVEMAILDRYGAEEVSDAELIRFYQEFDSSKY
jgi:hypothetical protein